MIQRPRRVFDGGSLLTSFLGRTIFSDVEQLRRETETASTEKLSAVAAQGSYVQQFQQLVFDGWGMQDVAVSLSNVVLNRFGNSWQSGLRPAVGGSVVALGIQVSQARTNGSCTVTVFIAGQASDLSATIDGDATLTVLEILSVGDVTFDAGEEITLRVSTSSTWAPVTADLTSWIVVNFDDL